MLIFTQGPGNLKLHCSNTVETRTVMYSYIFTKDIHRKRGIDDIMRQGFQWFVLQKHRGEIGENCLRANLTPFTFYLEKNCIFQRDNEESTKKKPIIGCTA